MNSKLPGELWFMNGNAPASRAQVEYASRIAGELGLTDVGVEGKIGRYAQGKKVFTDLTMNEISMVIDELKEDRRSRNCRNRKRRVEK